jgi:aspartokinase/homoserine dehydrogenase 1
VRGPIDVYKFGGAAVGNAEAVRIAGEHVRRATGHLVVVVSAMQGVTDLLLESANAALRGRTATSDPFAARHIEVIDGLIRARALRDRLRREVERTARELESMCESVSVLHELTPRAADAILARGERLMAHIFAAYVGADYVDATELIFTERRLGSVWPDFRKSERAAAKVMRSFDGPVVVPGFIATGPDGEVTTLGRGGSDFSAAILARTLGARSVTLFKEVDGLMTADPKSVPNARVLEEVHYREAAELAFYGAKVLHPRTMIPLVDREIPLYIRNSFQSQLPGTRIAADVKPGAYPVKALAAIHSQALVAIEGKGMIGVPGVAGRAFSALAQAGHSVSMISQASSESSICFVVPETEAAHATAALEEAFEPERRLKLIDRIHAEKRIALIAVVGLGMRGRLGIAARTFSALSGHRVNVVAIAQGSSELNITIAIAEKDATRALVALHNEFQLDKIRPLADTSGRESKLTLLGFGQIGRALAKQLVEQEKPLRAQAGVDLKVIAIADRSGIKVEEEGFTPAALQKISDHKASGGRIFDRTSPLTLKQLQSMMAGELWLLPSHRPILVDLTSDETAPLLQEALEHGFHIVLANKKPLAVPQIEYDRLFQTAHERGLAIRYEATAGAGLPVLDTIAKLQEAGDHVEKIVGCFSGTLGFITTALEEGRSFSETVKEAQTRGYTEPDPLDDLSGRDVARKALILARTLGLRVEFEDIDLQPMATKTGGKALDSQFAKRSERARREDLVLRYVATISRAGIRVALEAVPANSPMGSLHGTANQVAIYSKRYKTNPLVVTGPGAGADVTAAGVLNDILAITIQERRR